MSISCHPSVQELKKEKIFLKTRNLNKISTNCAGKFFFNDVISIWDIITVINLYFVYLFSS